MSGHNKWLRIKHKKAKEDSKKSKVFTWLIKESTVRHAVDAKVEIEKIREQVQNIV